MRPGGEIGEGKIDLRPRLTGEEVRCHHASHSGNPWCGLASSFCLWPVAAIVKLGVRVGARARGCACERCV